MTETPVNTAPRQRKWPRLFLALAALVGSALLSLYLFVDDFEVRIDETTAQAALDETLAERPLKRLGIRIEPKQFDISFSEDGRVGLAANIDLEGFNRSGSLDGVFRSGIRYSDGRFYLDNIAPVTSTVTLDNDTADEISDIAKVFRERLTRERDAIADEATSDAFGRLVDQNLARIEEAATDAAKAFFTSIPIYDLRKAGTGGTLARLALKDVYFEDGEAIITMSPQLAVAKILSFIAMLLLIGVYIFLSNPLMLVELGGKKKKSGSRP